MLKNNLLLLILFLISISCKKTEIDLQSTNSSPLVEEIYKVVDSISNYLPKPYPNVIYTVTHEKKDNKDYIKISTAKYINKDSISVYKNYENHLIVFYSKKFFKDKFNKLDTIGLSKYDSLMYNQEDIYMYHPRYEVVELLENNKFKVLLPQEHHQKKLFYFDDIYILEPEPNNSQ